MTWVHVALAVLVTIIVLVIAVSRSYALGRESGERDTLAGQGSDSGSLFGTESGPASTYANVFMVGGIIVLGAMVIFICSMKMIYSRSRVAEDES